MEQTKRPRRPRASSAAGVLGADPHRSRR